MEITSRKEEMKRKREKQDIATALDLSGFSFHKIQIQWGRNHTSWGLLWPLLASNPQWGLPVIWPPWGLTGAPGQGVGHCIQCASDWWKFWTRGSRGVACGTLHHPIFFRAAPPTRTFQLFWASNNFILRPSVSQTFQLYSLVLWISLIAEGPGHSTSLETPGVLSTQHGAKAAK